MTDYKLPQEQEKRNDITTGVEEVDNERLHIYRNRHEVQPIVSRTGNDYVVENRHNASIVLGRDYEYDDLNDTSIGMVDITAGRLANADITGKPITVEEGATESSGDLIADAAKVYISQKTDIDALYGFTPSNPATNRSAVGIKASNNTEYN